MELAAYCGCGQNLLVKESTRQGGQGSLFVPTNYLWQPPYTPTLRSLDVLR
jgi:hypothetical protein